MQLILTFTLTALKQLQKIHHYAVSSICFSQNYCFIHLKLQWFVCQVW